MENALRKKRLKDLEELLTKVDADEYTRVEFRSLFIGSMREQLDQALTAQRASIYKEVRTDIARASTLFPDNPLADALFRGLIAKYSTPQQKEEKEI